MPTRRKQLQQYQIHKILQERHIILFFQYSNSRLKEWNSLKKSLLGAMPNALKLTVQKLLTPSFSYPVDETNRAEMCEQSTQPKVKGGCAVRVETHKLSDARTPMYGIAGAFFDEENEEQGIFSSPFLILLVKNRIANLCVPLAASRFQEPFVASIASRCTAKVKDSANRLLRNPQAGPKDYPLKTAQEKEKAQFSISMDNIPMDTFTGKICKSSCYTLMEEKKEAYLFQGPTLLFACNSHRDMTTACKAINQNPNWGHSIVLLGGIYYGKPMTHLDLAKLFRLDLAGVYESLACSLMEKVSSLIDHGLSFYQSQLISCLDCYISSFASVEQK